MDKMTSLLVMLLSVFMMNTYGQFNVTQSTNANALAQYLGGAGVIISNATLVCPTSNGVSFAGTFTNAPNGLGISDGVLLTTGQSTELLATTGSTYFTSSSANAAGDTDLDALLVSLGETYTTNDACVLEFDIEVTGDSLSFNYAMGSEEYPTYVCGTVNDIFGFFISGPNPAGGNYVNQNIALIPNTTIPVSINTVNNGGTGAAATCYNGTYLQFMNPSIAPISAVDSIAYNEITAVLEAKAATVPCQTYHFKLAIADGGDWIFDSGVFLQAGSFSSTAVVIGASSVLGAGFTDAVEGCANGLFTIEIDTPYNFPLWVHYDISGSAINGTDYTTILDSILFPAGDTVVSLNIDVINDNIAEGTETLILTPYTECGTLGEPDTLTIVDEYPHGIIISDTFSCTPTVVTLTGFGGQTYSWSDSTILVDPDSTTTNTINPISQNTTFYLEGTLGTCTFYDTASIAINQSAPTFHIQDISCAGANDGAYWIELNDSVEVPFTYNFVFVAGSNPADSIQSNLAPGPQLVTATDALGCVFSGPFYTFTDPTAMIFSYDSIPISCTGANDGQICIYGVANGTYTVLIDTNGTQYNSLNITINNDTACFGPLAPGTYDVFFTNDTLACSGSFTTTLIDPAGMSFDYDTTNISCAGGNDGEICIFGVANGTYSATYTYQGLANIFNFTINNDTACISNLTAGFYDINLVNDITLCSGDFTVNLTEPDTLQVGIGVMSSGLCAGGSIDSLISIVSGGTIAYQYAWNTSATSPNLTSVAFSTYTLIVTDNNGCIDSASVTIAPPSNMYLNIAQDSVLCFGANTGLAYVDSFSGGNLPLTYSWNDILGQNTDTATVSAGQYILTITDFNGCIISDTVDVYEPTPLTINLTTDQISCFGGDTCIDATISGGVSPYNYLWNDALAQTTEDVCGLIAGTYSILVSDLNLCTLSDTITITEVAEILLSKDSINVLCFGDATGSATVNTTGGSGNYTYLWDDALAQTTATATNLTTGVYSVIVSDANDINCTKTISFNITEPAAALSASLDNVVDVICNGGSTGEINVNIAGGSIPYNFSWTNGTIIEDLQGAIANSYTLTVSDNNGCTTTYSDIINQPQPLAITLDATNDVSCFGLSDGSIDISVTGGVGTYTYLWSDGQTTATATNLAPNTYNCNIQDANGCTETIQVIINEADAIIVTTTVYSARCWGNADGVINVIATGGNGNDFEYSIDGGLTFQTGSVFTGLTAGVYNGIIVKQEGSGNCTTTPISEIVEQPGPMFVFINPEDTTIQIQETVPFNITVDPATSYYPGGSYSTADITNIDWNPTSGLSCTDCLNPTVLTYDHENEYTATVTYSPYGCTTSATAYILIENNLLYFIPDGFSPGGDGINDVFRIYGEGLREISLIIYNRWGEKLFETSKQTEGWDGTYKSTLQNPGVYIYHFEGVYLDGKEITKKGSISLIR